MANGQDDVRMTLRVSRDSGQTWGPLAEVRVGEDPVVPENPGRYPPCLPPVFAAGTECHRVLPDGVVMRCAHWRRVPLDLAREAREKSAAPYIDRAVQCQLSAHGEGEHFGLLTDAGACGTALWLRWHGPDEAELVVLPDCPVAAPGPDGEGCCLIADAMQHTWEDALKEVSCTN